MNDLISRQAAENIEKAKEMGYEQYYNWQYKNKDMTCGRVVNLFTKTEPLAEGEKDGTKR